MVIINILSMSIQPRQDEEEVAFFSQIADISDPKNILTILPNVLFAQVGNCAPGKGYIWKEFQIIRWWSARRDPSGPSRRTDRNSSIMSRPSTNTSTGISTGPCPLSFTLHRISSCSCLFASSGSLHLGFNKFMLCCAHVYVWLIHTPVWSDHPMRGFRDRRRSRSD